MLSLDDFSPRDWELAPTYSNPAITPGVLALDFGILKSIVHSEENIGSFRKTRDGTFAKAPLHVDDMRAALYLVNSKGPESITPNHNMSVDETLVVVEGVLKIIRNNGQNREPDASLHNSFYSGQVLRFNQNDAVSMQAVSVFDEARCIALALYPEQEQKIQIASY